MRHKKHDLRIETTRVGHSILFTTAPVVVSIHVAFCVASVREVEILRSMEVAILMVIQSGWIFDHGSLAATDISHDVTRTLEVVAVTRWSSQYDYRIGFGFVR